MTILYLCNKKACDECKPGCTHTPKIEFAKTFVSITQDIIMETDNLVKPPFVRGLPWTTEYEKMICHIDDAKPIFDKESGTMVRSNKHLNNPAEEWLRKFAENHGLTIEEARNSPMGKARLQVFMEAGY